MAIELAYRTVDVFTDRPLAGNALCVVLDQCPEPVMAAIAREVNLSETTFPVVTGENSYDVRIWTPGGEMSFAGHPTLGTAWVLGPGTWTQVSSGATVTVVVDAGGAVMTQPDPSLTERPDLVADAVSALGLPGAEGAWLAEVGGTRHVLVPTEGPLDQLAVDMTQAALLLRGLGGTGLAPVRRIDDHTLHARVFVPGIGVPEDPGTGSAAGPLGVLCRQRWGMEAELTIRQGAEIGRPCLIEVVAEPGGVRVGGRVAACAEGRFTL